MIFRIKRIYLILAAIAAILALPLIAMQFTSEVNWSPLDFLVMAVLLTATGLGSELVLRKLRTTRSRLLAIGVILLVFLLIWAELAVGIFGTPLAGS